MQWPTALGPFYQDEPRMLDGEWVAERAAEEWNPDEDDRTAAAKLHVQLISRVATRPLGYLEGDEKTALKSVHSLFEKTREICTAHPKAQHFEALAWHVLNEKVRWFTAKWHGRSARGALDALDATDEFRADLNALQPLLQQLDALLLFMRRDPVPASPPTVTQAKPPEKSNSEILIEKEFAETVAGGIREEFSGFVDPSIVSGINHAERDAIVERRRHYGIADTPHVTGLALSGGGIRSATFSLGVLVALARRNLLPQFDYLSTVSGGGYLGSFLTAFLQSPAPGVGLERTELPFKREEGEAAALRHIRHHSKYLAVSSLWERLTTLAAQFRGMLLNFLAVLWLAVLAVICEAWLRSHPLPHSTPALKIAIGALAISAVVSLFILRWWSGRAGARASADWILTVAAGLVVAVILWHRLEWLHGWFAAPHFASWTPPGDRNIWMTILGAVPLLRPALAAVSPKALKRAGAILNWLTALAAPLFLLGVYLWIYETWPHAAESVKWLVVVGGAVIYLMLFDINATSPHGFYRRKLAQAYLIRPRLRDGVYLDNEFDEDVPQKLSTRCKKRPYHLISCAFNVPGSSDIAMQGRLTDFFLFSQAFCGSPLRGFRKTQAWESLNPRLDLSTAMAISGAAVAPQMGTGTIRRFTFWLALLNVRLSHWVRQPDPPGRLGKITGAVPPGLLHLLMEMTGWMSEKGAWINLSDGGHIENLGIYELLRRRCRFILAVDGEEDASMTFQGLTTLQRLAEIDLGVRIEANLDDLRLNAAGLSRSHFRFCRIRYPKGARGSDDEFGYLLYLKLSLTGNEGEFIRRYRLDEPAFPHHSTADQFFGEAQFEAYRNLGEHVGNKLFLRAVLGDLADADSIDLETWFKTMGEKLLEPAARART